MITRHRELSEARVVEKLHACGINVPVIDERAIVCENAAFGRIKLYTLCHHRRRLRCRLDRNDGLRRRRQIDIRIRSVGQRSIVLKDSRIQENVPIVLENGAAVYFALLVLTVIHGSGLDVILRDVILPGELDPLVIVELPAVRVVGGDDILIFPVVDDRSEVVHLAVHYNAAVVRKFSAFLNRQLAVSFLGLDRLLALSFLIRLAFRALNGNNAVVDDLTTGAQVQ